MSIELVEELRAQIAALQARLEMCHEANAMLEDDYARVVAAIAGALRRESWHGAAAFVEEEFGPGQEH